MFLKQLHLLNFRNHSQYDVHFNEPIIAFIGRNGIGKTNLLDAIHHLCYAKGFINSIDGQNIKTNEDFYLIQGSFEKDEQTSSVSCSLKKGHKKVLKINDKVYKKIADHIGKFTAIVISPNDTIAINESSEERRKLLDTLICQMHPEYLEALLNYNHILKQRNSFLKSPSFDSGLIDAYNLQLHLYGTKIHQKRHEVMLGLQPLFQSFYTTISAQQEEVELIYQSDLSQSPLIDLLEHSFQKDCILQSTSKGIHKDDVLFLVNGSPMKRYASQGQQKSIMIALKLAQYEFLKSINSNKPFFLLDDVFDKLDQSRISRLIEVILAQKNNGQLFITHTDSTTLKAILEPLGQGFEMIQLED